MQDVMAGDVADERCRRPGCNRPRYWGMAWRTLWDAHVQTKYGYCSQECYGIALGEAENVALLDSDPPSVG